MLAAIRRTLFRMTGVLPSVGFGRRPEPPTGPISSDVEPSEPAASAELREQRHVNATSQQQRGGKHPER